LAANQRPAGSAIPSNDQPVSASDTIVYDPPLLGLYVGSAGNVRILSWNQYGQGDAGVPSVYENVPAGFIIPVQIAMVYDTDTTAGSFVGFGPT
jgi:hypothetical protein